MDEEIVAELIGRETRPMLSCSLAMELCGQLRLDPREQWTKPLPHPVWEIEPTGRVVEALAE